mmetsp:Transcript_18419/g.34106  ORF Transcript_18419/g.34106 Transcript_18419/m.34106 type:complete len:92 (+) Transcript_18419:1171-1446(+)
MPPNGTDSPKDEDDCEDGIDMELTLHSPADLNREIAERRSVASKQRVPFPFDVVSQTGHLGEAFLRAYFLLPPRVATLILLDCKPQSCKHL